MIEERIPSFNDTRGFDELDPDEFLPIQEEETWNDQGYSHPPTPTEREINITWGDSDDEVPMQLDNESTETEEDLYDCTGLLTNEELDTSSDSFDPIIYDSDGESGRLTPEGEMM